MLEFAQVDGEVYGVARAKATALHPRERIRGGGDRCLGHVPVAIDDRGHTARTAYHARDEIRERGDRGNNVVLELQQDRRGGLEQPIAVARMYCDPALLLSFLHPNV